MTFPDSPFTSEINASDIATTMQELKGWEARYRQVILWGKSLPKMSDSDKTEQVTVSGCESQVWLLGQHKNGHWRFCADSDARIVRGLIALVMAAYDGATTEEIIAFDIEEYFSELGLIQHLSPSRGNGLKSIVETIQAQVRATIE